MGKRAENFAVVENIDTFAQEPKLYTGSETDLKMFKDLGLVTLNIASDCNSNSKSVVEPFMGLCVTKNMKQHEQYDDIFAAAHLYRLKLEEFGLDRFFKQILNKRKVTKPFKGVVLLGRAEKNGFCYRHVIAKWLSDNGCECVEFGREADYADYIEKRSLEFLTDNYKNTGAEILSDDELEALLEQNSWKFAKSMPHAPHWYTLRQSWDAKLFKQVYLSIREKGELVVDFGSVWRIFKGKEYKYFTHYTGVHKAGKNSIASNIVLINKAKI